MGNTIKKVFETEEDRRRQHHEAYKRVVNEQERRARIQREAAERQLLEQVRFETENAKRHHEKLQFEQEERKRILIEAAKWRASLTYTLTNTIGIFPWAQAEATSVLTYVTLSEAGSEFSRVNALFNSTSKNQGLKILKIEQCQNPTLYGQFLMKKEELKSRYGHVSVELLFHGTKISNVDTITEYNFDWRRHGTSVGNRYGKGVSFSPIAAYASHYCDKKTSIKIMLLCEVLVSKSCLGNPNMVLPDVYDNHRQLRYDTAIKCDNNKTSVIVKFSDHEFYPLYKIHFQVEPRKYNGNKKQM